MVSRSGRCPRAQDGQQVGEYQVRHTAEAIVSGRSSVSSATCGAGTLTTWRAPACGWRAGCAAPRRGIRAGPPRAGRRGLPNPLRRGHPRGGPPRGCAPAAGQLQNRLATRRELLRPERRRRKRGVEVPGGAADRPCLDLDWTSGSRPERALQSRAKRSKSPRGTSLDGCSAGRKPCHPFPKSTAAFAVLPAQFTTLSAVPQVGPRPGKVTSTRHRDP